MNLRQLRYFLGVAQTLHFSKAAEQLNIVQSALSRQIQQLEDEWGVQLFERDKRNVRLTVAGIFLQQEATRLLNQAEHIRRQAQLIHRGEAGELRIAYPGSAIYSVLPDLLKQQQERLPNVRVSLLELLDANMFAGLVDLSVDIGFTREPISDPRLQSRLLISEPLSLVVPVEHWATDKLNDHLPKLAGERFILPPRYAGEIYHNLIEKLFEQIGSPPTPLLESNFGATILQLVEQGLGISILPYSYHKGAGPKVRFIKLVGDQYQTYLSMVWRRNDPNPVVKSWLTLLSIDGDTI
jgi:DNA-binding transcriptional LysR family regulator